MESSPQPNISKLQDLYAQIIQENNDFKGVNQKAKIVSLFGGQPLVFSDSISKINQNNWTQSRTLVITQDKIFNIDKEKSKREM